MKAIYPGSFDPVTNGHIDIIERAAKLVDKLVVAVAMNLEKEAMFETQERVDLLRQACRHLANVEVDYFHGLTVSYARKHEARLIIKGLRAVSDFEFELQQALMNKRLDDGIETMFMMTSAEYLFLSSSMVKQLAMLGASVTGLVPDGVEKLLLEKTKLMQR
ncbi:MAG: pantetheine-phosphate adenylyltransferase [Armatimonadetes bacterium]|jgi:pantetheine-phosphate adenylyltransferase|nr:pantetheine-phosphate adenylyltransferase [Armatimonadota bacterium]